MSKVIAIANQKGGCAKTTTSINLGIGLVRQGKKVCLVDLDPQGNATQGLGYDADSLEVTISTMMRNVINKDIGFEIETGICYHEEGIDLMPANIELSMLETELISMYFGREKVLRTYINRLRERYDYIIIDCLPSLNLITINALVAADEVVIQLHAQYFSVKGLEQLLQTIGSIISNDLNSSLKIAGILYTCVNDQTNSFKGIRDILENAYGKDILMVEFTEIEQPCYRRQYHEGD